MEILHTATLVHDDVVDDADTRRGLASINAVWKNKIAVLMGDYLLSRGLLLSLEHDDFAFLKITSTSVRRMSEGELHQIQKSRKLDMDEDDLPADHRRQDGVAPVDLLRNRRDERDGRPGAAAQHCGSTGKTWGWHFRSATTCWTTSGGRASRESRRGWT